jgi:hypothetical protein
MALDHPYVERKAQLNFKLAGDTFVAGARFRRVGEHSKMELFQKRVEV